MSKRQKTVSQSPNNKKDNLVQQTLQIGVQQPQLHQTNVNSSRHEVAQVLNPVLPAQIQNQEERKNEGGKKDDSIDLIPPTQDLIVEQVKHESATNKKKRRSNKAEVKEDAALQQLLQGAAMKDEIPKRAQRQRKKPITYTEGESDVPVTEDSSLPKDRQVASPKLDAILVFYNSMLKIQQDDQSVCALVKDVTAILQASLNELPDHQSQLLHERFEGIVREKFEEWRTSKVKPDVWYAISPLTICKVIVYKLEREMIEVVTLGQWASLLKSLINSNGFDMTPLPDALHLVNNLQVQKFCQLLLSCYKTENTIQLKKAPAIFCVKLGQVRMLFEFVASVQGSFNPNFNLQGGTVKTVSNKSAAKNKNEAKLTAGIYEVYRNISEPTSVKFAQGNNWKNIAWNGVCLALNNIVQQRHVQLINILTTALGPTQADPGNFVSKLDETDPDQVYINVVLKCLQYKPDQYFDQTQLIKMIRHMKNSGLNNTGQALQLCNYDLSVYLKQYEHGAVTAESVDKSLVHAWVMDSIKKMPDGKRQEFQKVYDCILELVKKHIEVQVLPTSVFERDSYQIYVAAHICLTDAPYICQIYSGQGKTVIMLLCALYYIHEKKYQAVTFVTSSKILCAQLKRDIGKLYSSGSNSFFEYGYPQEPNSIKPNQAMIVDEADLSLAHCISLDRETNLLNGLYHLKNATKAIYLSATMPTYFTKLITNCFGPFEHVTFTSQYQICSKAQSPHEIIAECFNESQVLIQKACQDFIEIGKLAKDKQFPVILFVEQWNEKMISDLNQSVAIAYSNKGFFQVRDEQSLQNVLPFLKSQTTGAVVLPASMGRGLNVRFSGDCEVRVIANGDGLSWEDVCQMVGRSCRRFGLCKGKVYVLSQFAGEDITEGGEQILRRNENNLDTDEGPFIAGHLINKFNKIVDPKERKQFLKAIKAEKEPINWRVIREDFAQGDARVLKFTKLNDYQWSSQNY